MLQSCLNDDDENRGTRFTIGTIEVIGEKEYFFNLDDGDKMYPSDTTYIHNYTVENNQRVFIHFLPLEEDIPGYDYNVKLIQLENILTKDIIPLTEETADSIGNDRINATSLWITGNYLNIEHQFFHSNNPDKKHMLNLVINETAETPDPEDEYFTLEFRHNAYNDEQRTPGWGIVSFRLDKIAKLKRDLVDIDKQKSVQRKNRGKMVRVALVGYTNVGKSTLMNQLSKSDVFAENKLFATLDTTVRKVIVENLPFLLSDTVGFIRKLPTELVESFKSTLDEVREADLLVHVVDISHPTFEEQIEVVNKTLAEIDKTEKPMIMVFNKIDAFTFVPKDEDDLTPRKRENIDLDELKRTWMNKLQDNCIFISAKERTNIDALKALLYERVKQIHITRFPYNDFLFQQYDEE